MKTQIVKTFVSNIIAVDNHTPDTTKYYGLRVKSCNQRGFMLREAYGYGNYKVYAPELMTGGNRFSTLESNTIEGCIQKILEGDNRELFVFDTFKELMDWVAESKGL